VIRFKKIIILFLWIFINIIMLGLLFGLLFFIKEKMIIDYIRLLFTFIVFLFFNKVFFSLYKMITR